MKTVTVQAFDRNGIEIKEGDIIQSEYGVKTMVQFDEAARQYFAYDEIPFPCRHNEKEIRKYFEVIGHISQTPSFVFVYEAEISYNKSQENKKPRKSLIERIFG